jgi:peptidyl-dipeptidase Dcp
MNNPFFTESPLPYGLPPFDRIADEHFLPAFESGMKIESAEITSIASNPEAPTFENTIVALERSGQMLARARTVFGNLTSADTNDTLNEIEREMAPKFAAHEDSIRLNPDLFARIAYLYEKRDSLNLDAESLVLLKRYHTDFIRAGAALPPEKKERLREINSEYAELRTAFSQNVLDEVNDAAIAVATRAELDGLSESQIQAAAEEAASRGSQSPFVLTLTNTTLQPVLSSLTNRELRRRIHEISSSRGARGNMYDNRAIFARVLALRAERAALLGYENHASYVLDDQTAGTTEAVNDMLARLAPPSIENARREAEDLQALANETESEAFMLAAWDWLYYAEQLRERRYDFDSEQLKPYFELNRVLENGAFYFAERLYGLTFEERPELPTYHEDVRIFEAFLDEEPIGLFLFDPYARESKNGGAWMSGYVTQSRLMNRKPVVANHLNIVKPPPGEPTLMTLDEVTTMFHEFGHAIHGLFSNVAYPRLSGTRVPRDFVEFPSQVHEMWAVWPEVLANYAVHYETSEPIPEALLNRVLDAQKFNQGFATTEYLAASIVDQAWHQLEPENIPEPDALAAFEQEILAQAGMDFAPVPPRYHTPYFSHIMGGYAAGYYSYIWSEVLDADTERWFEENGGLKRENGDRFRAELLSKGSSEDAMEIYMNFRGAAPSIEPLLERRGLN